MWTEFVSGSLPDPYMKDPVPMETLSGTPTIVEEVEFSCVKSWGTWCALSYIEFRSNDTIVNRHEGKCLHINDVNSDGSSPNDYTQVVKRDCGGSWGASNKQRWAFNGLGQIIHTPSGKCLDMGMYVTFKSHGVHQRSKMGSVTIPFFTPD